jgi:hypothetical protein
MVLNEEQKHAELLRIDELNTNDLLEKVETIRNELVETREKAPSIMISKNSEMFPYLIYEDNGYIEEIKFDEEGNVRLQINDILKCAKNGIAMRFNINTVLKGFVIEYPDSQHVKIKGYMKANLHEYWQEMQDRRVLLKQFLRKYLSEEEKQYRGMK